MWKKYYIKNYIINIIEKNKNIINKSIYTFNEYINILSNIDFFKKLLINTNIENNSNIEYCNEIQIICIFSLNNQTKYKYYYFSLHNNLLNSNYILNLKELTENEYNNYEENISESYKFGYNTWKEDNNIDFNNIINNLDWSKIECDFYNLDSYKYIMKNIDFLQNESYNNYIIYNNNKELYNTNIKIINKLISINLFDLLNNNNNNDHKICNFNKIKSNCYYFFDYIFFIKLNNNNVIVINLVDENNEYNYDRNIELNIIEYKNLIDYFEITKEIYDITYNKELKNIINYHYLIEMINI